MPTHWDTCLNGPITTAEWLQLTTSVFDPIDGEPRIGTCIRSCDYDMALKEYYIPFKCGNDSPQEEICDGDKDQQCNFRQSIVATSSDFISTVQVVLKKSIINNSVVSNPGEEFPGSFYFPPNNSTKELHFEIECNINEPEYNKFCTNSFHFSIDDIFELKSTMNSNDIINELFKNKKKINEKIIFWRYKNTENGKWIEITNITKKNKIKFPRFKTSLIFESYTACGKLDTIIWDIYIHRKEMIHIDDWWYSLWDCGYEKCNLKYTDFRICNFYFDPKSILFQNMLNPFHGINQTKQYISPSTLPQALPSPPPPSPPSVSTRSQSPSPPSISTQSQSPSPPSISTQSQPPSPPSISTQSQMPKPPSDSTQSQTTKPPSDLAQSQTTKPTSILTQQTPEPPSVSTQSQTTNSPSVLAQSQTTKPTSILTQQTPEPPSVSTQSQTTNSPSVLAQSQTTKPPSVLTQQTPEPPSVSTLSQTTKPTSILTQQTPEPPVVLAESGTLGGSGAVGEIGIGWEFHGFECTWEYMNARESKTTWINTTSFGINQKLIDIDISLKMQNMEITEIISKCNFYFKKKNDIKLIIEKRNKNFFIKNCDYPRWNVIDPNDHGRFIHEKCIETAWAIDLYDRKPAPFQSCSGSMVYPSTDSINSDVDTIYTDTKPLTCCNSDTTNFTCQLIDGYRIGICTDSNVPNMYYTPNVVVQLQGRTITSHLLALGCALALVSFLAAMMLNRVAYPPVNLQDGYSLMNDSIE